MIVPRKAAVELILQLEEVQGATTSSHIPPPLLQDPWPCVQLLRAERHAPCQ